MTKEKRLLKTIQKNIRVRMSDEDLSMRGLAKKSGIPMTTIQAILHENRVNCPSYYHVLTLASALGCNTEELVS